TWNRRDSFPGRLDDLPDGGRLPCVLDDFLSTGYFSAGRAAGWIVSIVNVFVEYEFSSVKIVPAGRTSVGRINLYGYYMFVLDGEDIVVPIAPSGYRNDEEKTVPL